MNLIAYGASLVTRTLTGVAVVALIATTPTAGRRVQSFDVAPSDPTPSHSREIVGTKYLAALGCQDELNHDSAGRVVLPKSVVISSGYDVRKQDLDTAWKLVSKTGNTWRVVGFCYR